jgi:uncharacterized protein
VPADRACTAWEAVAKPAEITLDSLAPVFAAAADLDVLLIGLGKEIAGPRPGDPGGAARAGIIVEAIATGGAVRTYNILLAEIGRSARRCIAVDSAR